MKVLGLSKLWVAVLIVALPFMVQAKKVLKSILLILLLLPLVAIAQPYIITGSGTSFTTTRSGLTIGSANQPIQTVINTIKADADGKPCEIQFGNGVNELDIGEASINLDGSAPGWNVVLSGKIVSSHANHPVIHLSDDANVESRANVRSINSYAITNGIGTLTIRGGTISAATGAIFTDGTVNISGGIISGDGYAIYNQNGMVNITGGTISADYAVYGGPLGTGSVNISGGTIFATGANAAVHNLTTGEINISGTANITSANTSATNGTIFVMEGNLKITGGTITNTATDGNAIYNSSTGSVALGGSPTIIGNIRKRATAGNFEVIIEGDNVFEPAGKIYTLAFTTYAQGNVAVENGKDFLDNFVLANSVWGVMADGDNLVMATAVEVACLAEGKVWENGFCREKTPQEICSEKGYFYKQIGAYAAVDRNVVIEVCQNLTLDQLVTIPQLATAGRTLTIRSVNPSTPVTLTRGVSGNLFTVSSGATLILENIVIDGDKDGDFVGGGGTLILVNSGGTLVMNYGAVLRNNISPSFGGGVYVLGGAFTMNGGEINENTAHGSSSGHAGVGGGSGVQVSGGIFTMNNGKISENIAFYGGGVCVIGGTFIMNGGEITQNIAVDSGEFGDGGGVHVSNSGSTFTMNGGKISGNIAGLNGDGVYAGYGGTFTMNGGFVFGVYGSYKLNENGGDGIIITWNKPNSVGPFVYIEGTDNNLLYEPTEDIAVLWAIKGGKFGVSYKNGSNEGFVEVAGITVITQEEADNAVIETVTTVDDFYKQVAAYATLGRDVIIEIGQDITLNQTVSIPASVTTAGKTLTIRSVNPNEPVTLKRGISVNLFTVLSDATLILEDIVIDGGRLVVNDDGLLVMNDGAVVRNSTNGGVSVMGTFTMNGGEISGNAGSGVYVYGTFTMNGGEISGNTATYGGGGVDVSGTFIMNGGEISRNTAINSDGGGVLVNGIFTMNNGKISENVARSGSGIYRTIGVNFSGTVNLNGGVVAGTESSISNVVYGTYSSSAPANSIIIAWNKPAGIGPFVYIEGTNNHLIVSPTEGATALWAIENGKFGVSYKNGDNEGFVEIAGITVIMQEEADTPIIETVATLDDFYKQIASYAIAGRDVIIEFAQNLALDQPVSIPTPVTVAGKTLTIRSANSDEAVTLERGVSYDLFTILSGATLIFENIVIDGGRDDKFTTNSGLLVSVGNGGSFIMNNDAVIRNNAFSAVQVVGGTFTMNGGAVHDNGNGSQIWSNSDGAFTINGGIVFGTGTNVNVIISGGAYNLNNGVIVAWNKPTGNGPFVYIEGTSNHLIVSPTEGVTVLWAIENGKFGVSYKNGDSRGFVEVAGITVITQEEADIPIIETVATLDDFYKQVALYATLGKNVIIEIASDLTLDQLVNIALVTTTDKTLTIRSTNPNKPVTLKRGVNGTLFTVLNGTLILEDIVIDGDFATGAPLVWVNNGSVLVMNNGAVVRNGGSGGVYVIGTFTMNGGEISGNSLNSVYINSGSTFNLNGGIVVGIGTNINNVVNGTYNLSNGIIIAWNKPTGTGPLIYIEGTNNNLLYEPTEGATVLWAIENGKFGISYKNGDNEGFVEIAGVTVITQEEADTPIIETVTVLDDFYKQVAAYATLGRNLIIEVGQDLTLDQLVNIPAPVTAIGRTLTIRSANPNEPSILMRGVSGSLLTVSSSARLILENIVIDGGRDDKFTANSGPLVGINGSALVMNDGAVMRNNASSAVSVVGGTFTMNGGIVAGVGTSVSNVVNGTYDNTGGIVVAWSKPTSDGPFVYIEGTNNNLLPNPSNATILWAVESDKFGISYKNGTNEGFVEVAGITVITQEEADTPIIETVTTLDDFYKQIASYATLGRNLIIEVGQDLTLDQLVNIPAPVTAIGRTLTIRSANFEEPVTLKRSINGYLFTVFSEATLILENIIIDGGSLSIHSGGTLIMNEGAIVRNNNGNCVSVNGTFIMMGGVINGSIPVNAGDNGSVRVYNGAFIMSGGVISGSSGRGVYVGNGTFTMTGGEISGNTAGIGGGVHVGYGSFTMTGGTINGNTAIYGGGVYIGNNGTLSLGGTAIITGNTNNLGIANNVFLENNQYISLSTDFEPSEEMSIGITKTANSRVFVQSGAKTNYAKYFYDDSAEKTISFYNGALIIGSHFYYQVENYATAKDDVIIEVEQDIVLDRLINIPENASGKTLTIRSANPNKLAILKRGIGGELLTIFNGATLILEDIVIDGGRLVVNDGGKLILNENAVIRNNAGGGVSVMGTFTMNGGEISGNTGSGVYVMGSSVFIMNGGVISGNGGSVAFGKDVYVGNNSTFTMNGGVITGIGTSINDVVSGAYNLNNGTPNNGIIIVWNKPTGTGPFVYIEGTDNNLLYEPTEDVTAFWAIENGKFGISYKNGDNEDFVEIAGITVITQEEAETPIKTVITVSDFYKQIAVYAVTGKDVIIEVGQDLTLDQLVNVTLALATDATLTIRSANPVAPVTLTRGISGNLFTVSAGANLILENIIIDGDRDGTFTNGGGSLVRVNDDGTFILNKNTIIRNNVGGGVDLSSGAFTMSGGEISGNTATYGGGGVDVNSNSIFTMNGGEISDNTASSGGGVSVNSGGTFTMSGGEISGNTATYGSTGGGGGGGVFVNGIFIMKNGKISGNMVPSTWGGGVSVNGTFIMTGGEISNNTDRGAGNVNVYNIGTFTMSGGIISNNNTSNCGVAVRGIFTMNGGKISDNGSGVDVQQAGKFTMIDGEISGNSNGVQNYSSFVMSGGKINNNGSGVSTSGSGSFTMSGGEISGNRGSGVYVISGTFTMSGGEISGNTTNGNGSGVYVQSYGSFTMSGGVVIGTGMSVVFGEYNLNNSKDPNAPNNGIIIVWNKPADTGPFTYTENTSTHLLHNPSEEVTAVWAIKDGKFGVSYKNGSNEGFVEIDGMTVKTLEELKIACMADDRVWENSTNTCRDRVAADCAAVEIFENETKTCRAITAGDCSATQKFEDGICRAITA
ncbi:MAG: hypothetical protein LBU89_03060, partial [Fibromonadaceae bacterium]|nr:hypothetical protein [Fibromonadaceae bacterium]